MTSTSADNRGSPSTTEKDTKNGATEKIETTQEENGDEGQTSVDNNIEETAETSDNDDGKIVYVANACLYYMHFLLILIHMSFFTHLMHLTNCQ